MFNFTKLDYVKKNKKNNIAIDEKDDKISFPIEKISDSVYQISPDNIVPNPLQPRKTFDDSSLFALANSIHQHGIIQPLTVRRLPNISNSSEPIYELVAGERRLRAAKLLNLASVPCIIIEIDKEKSGELSIIENLQREDLNFFEQASAIQKMIELFSLTQEQAAGKLSVSQSYIANKLRLLRLTSEEQEAILLCGLTERHARAFLRLSDENLRRRIIAMVAEKSMNVAAAERYIDNIINPPAVGKKQERIFVMKDIRLFFNSIDHAVSLIRESGISIKNDKVDKGDYIEVTIQVPKTKQQII